MVQHLVLLRDAAAVDHAIDRHAVLGHAFENHARVKRCSLDRCEEMILRRMVEVPAKGHAAEVRVHEHRAVAVIPRDVQQSGLPSTE